VQQSVFGQFVNVVMCEACQGEGHVVANPCKTCRGQGRLLGSKELMVKVPAGVDRGQQIRLSGEGEIGPKGGPPGDLYIVLNVLDHDLFKRDGYDLYYELSLNVAQAALGTELRIPTIDGDVDLTIPAGTQHGRDFRLRGKGVPHLRSSARGDLHVVARVVTPTKLSGRQRELFEELAVELEGQDEGDDKGFFGRVKEAFGG
jgi:molecular chaperone DnaJ